MTPNENSDVTATNLIALRAQPDALKIITERLKVKQMGPADHIRTKHEVKAFLESGGDMKEAEAIVRRAHTRRTHLACPPATFAPVAVTLSVVRRVRVSRPLSRFRRIALHRGGFAASWLRSSMGKPSR
jgi:hypothetical protein